MSNTEIKRMSFWFSSLFRESPSAPGETDLLVLSKYKAAGLTATRFGPSNGQDGGGHVLRIDGEGSAYEIGRITGLVMSREVELVCSEYIHHVVPEFLDQDNDHRMRNTSDEHEYDTYETFVNALTEIFLADTCENVEVDRTTEYYAEMVGIVDGAREAVQRDDRNPDESAVTMKKLVALNYGIDYLLSLIYTGEITSRLRTHMKKIKNKDLKDEICAFAGKYLRPPDMCNTAVFGRRATQDGRTIFARDFQFVNGRHFPEVATHIVRVTPGKTVCRLTVPGCVGAFTAVAVRPHQQSVACGINLVRSGNCRVFSGGKGILSGILSVRDAVEHGSDVSEAERLIRGAYGGVPWIFTVADSQHTVGAVLEMDSGSIKGSSTTTPLVGTHPGINHVIQNLGQRRPGRLFGASYMTEGELISTKAYNHVVGVPPDGFSTWQEESTWMRDHPPNGWFPIPKFVQDTLVGTNHFMLPDQRLGQMSKWAQLAERGSLASAWRMQQVMNGAKVHYGNIDRFKAMDIISFLSPDRHRDHPQNQVAARGNMPTLSVPIDGCLSVFDMRDGVYSFKLGRWGSEWVKITL